MSRQRPSIDSGQIGAMLLHQTVVAMTLRNNPRDKRRGRQSAETVERGSSPRMRSRGWRLSRARLIVSALLTLAAIFSAMGLAACGPTTDHDGVPQPTSTVTSPVVEEGTVAAPRWGIRRVR